MGRINKNTRIRILAEKEDVCMLCGEGPREGDPWTLDHIVPVCFGGGNAFENLQKAHEFCNHLHGAYLQVLIVEARRELLGYPPIKFDPLMYEEAIERLSA